MKNIIVGTAGHIDHGKTTLIKALTGRNTDRWEEEQRRGITIDLGFTWFDLPRGDRVGIIDVPGHEKFINNMVAGVVGMDLVLLVIAADEGIMPQTREHIDILGLLGIEKSIIVLNKCDLVDEDWLDMVKEDIRTELKGSFCQDAPMVQVSSTTGQGIPELVSLIEDMTANQVTQRDVDTIPRLPIDRVFSISGFGTVVTGTLISGRIRKEDQLTVFPVNRPCKIRSIQVHGKDAEECFAGQRVAINISNIKKDEIERGCVLAPVSSMKNTMMLDVRLSMLPSSPRTIENRTRLHLFTGTSQVLCRAVLLDRDTLGPGESCLAQLRLEEEIAVRRGDRFILRFYSPMETIGGGTVIEANPVKKKRFDEKVLSEMAIKEQGGHGDMLELLIKQHSDSAITAAELAKLTGLTLEETLSETAQLEEQGLVASFQMKKDLHLWHASFEKKVTEAMLEHLHAFHKDNPYRQGCRKAELRVRFLPKVKQNVFDEFIQRLEDRAVIKRSGEFIAAGDFVIPQDDTYLKVSSAVTKALDNAGFEFLKLGDIAIPGVAPAAAEDIVQLLAAQGSIVLLSDDLMTLPVYTDRVAAIAREMLAAEGKITIAGIRDAIGTSRKNAKPLLEYLDSVRITRRNGTESERVAY